MSPSCIVSSTYQDITVHYAVILMWLFIKEVPFVITSQDHISYTFLTVSHLSNLDLHLYFNSRVLLCILFKTISIIINDQIIEIALLLTASKNYTLLTRALSLHFNPFGFFCDVFIKIPHLLSSPCLPSFSQVWFYSGGNWFESRLECRLDFLFVSSVTPCKFWYVTYIHLRPYKWQFSHSASVDVL